MLTLSIVPSHDIARVVLDAIRTVLDAIGLGDSPTIEQVIYVAIVLFIALLIGCVVRKLITVVVKKIIALRNNDFARELLHEKVLQKCTHIIPPLVLLALLPFAFSSASETLSVIRRLVFIYLILMFGVGLSAIIEFIFVNYDRRANKQNHPLKGVVAVIKGVMWMVLIIISVAVLVDKSPMALLGGLGAFAAVLMLVFKDPILGFVASIQLSSNDMLRVGDWIVVPSTIANGVVIDVSLTVVKVQNWDNTIVMLPAYSLVSSPFQNWRGMSDSGVRQIDRRVIVDSCSIETADDALYASVSAKYPEMASYIADRQKLAAEGKEMVFNGGVAPVNGTLETNCGLFRAYLCKYLLAHPAIAHDQNIIVRLMEGTPEGTPIDIYCFTNTTDWLAYEAIRSQIIEHIIAVASDFNLRVVNSDNITISKES